jgi:transcriptional regulator with XRE-family HTH domain
MTTGERIRDARKAAGLTQLELAEKLGVPYQSIGQWENNVRNPKYETLEKIATALNVSVYRLKHGITMKSLGIKPWVSDKSARLNMSIDSTLLHDLEGLASEEKKTVEDYVEEILYFEVDNEVSKRQDDDLGY